MYCERFEMRYLLTLMDEYGKILLKTPYYLNGMMKEKYRAMLSSRRILSGVNLVRRSYFSMNVIYSQANPDAGHVAGIVGTDVRINKNKLRKCFFGLI